MNPILKLKLKAALLLIGIAALSGCATTYSGGLRVTDGYSAFSGKSDCTLERAAVYARLGAVHTCIAKGQLAAISEAADYSKRYRHVRVQQSDSGNDVSVHEWDVPIVEVGFECVPGNSVFKGGVMVEDPTGLVAEMFHLDQPLVAGVFDEKNSSLKKGDYIVRIDGERTRSAVDVTRALARHSSKRTVKVEVSRNSKMKTIDVPLQNDSEDLIRENLRVVSSACKFAKKHADQVPLCLVKPDKFKVFLGENFKESWNDDLLTELL